MTFLLLAAGSVLLVTLFHIAAGWAISNRLHTAVFVSQPRGKDLAVRVRDVSSDRIVLEAPTARQDIGHPGVLGLVWDGGHGRLGNVIDVRGAGVVRAFEPGLGLPPVCAGEIEDCPPVEIDPWVYPGDPSDVGLTFEHVTYEQPLGVMGAWLVPGGSGHRWALHCHGWTADKRELVRMLPTYHRHELTSMVIDYRNDPGAPGDPSGRYRFGLSEWEDLEAAVQYAVDAGAENVVLSGCSTGSAIVMAFLERSPLSSQVSGVVLDSPNIILADAIRHGTRDARATRLMIEFGMWVADLRWKIDWEGTNYVQRADTTLKMPTMVFHGTSDQTIPIAVSRQLEAKVPGLVELVETPAAGHVMSWNADPERYERYLGNFLGRI